MTSQQEMRKGTHNRKIFCSTNLGWICV